MPSPLAKCSIARAIATGLGSGLAPFSPGTFGSAAATAIWCASLQLCTAELRVVAAILLFSTLMVGIPAVARVLETSESKDPSSVVIDEWAGMFLVFSLCPVTSWRHILIAFALFRAFDITKPGPVRWAESLPGAWGVMADDVVAGALAAAALLALQYLQVL